MNIYQQIVRDAEAKERTMRQEAERREQLALWQYRLECSLIEDDDNVQPVNQRHANFWENVEYRYKSA